MAEHESNLAVLVDFENMARPGLKGRGDFDIHLVLNRLADKGRVLVKRAYADWSRYRDARHELQNAGLGLIEMPSAREGAKNRADIQMAVDAMELAYSRSHVDNFVIVSGDSDFTPLVGKLRELNKRVTGVGNRESASELLIANCDEFIFYDLLAGAGARTRSRAGAGGKTDPVELLRDTLTALQREGVEWPLASVVKDSMRRKYPAFDESDHGFSTYSKFLEDAAKRDLVRLETDPRSGTYRVEMTAGRDEVPALPPELMASAAADPAPAGDERADGAGEGRRRRRRRRGEPASAEATTDAAGAAGVADQGPEGEAMETFEVVIVPTPDITAAELPPLDEPISYEDMIMLGGDLDDDLPEDLAEVTDVSADAPPARSTRRRRRRGAGEPEPTVADLAPLDAAEAVQEPTMAPEVAEGTAEAPAEPEDGSRRRRRRRVSEPVEAAEEATPPEPSSEPEPVAVEAAPAEPVAEVAEAAPAAPTRTRGRVRRGTATVPADAEAAAEEEAPKPKRRTRKKAEPAAEVAAAEDEAPKPKRRTRKKAEPAADDGARVAAEAPADEAPKPKRRTRKKAEPAADAAAAEAPSAAEEAPKPKRRTRKKAEPAAADGDAAESPQAAAEAGEGS